ncbi:transmembrane emp24 domain-containing protein p24delta9-like [Hibiscus syriacus]|uniref:Transmembrane emp24 domain-containing protein p24delta9-like n=1 Tax=Hibiscus syriacus TaxID=106335 RepID=A0A6A3BWQ8_HIBSY|nr:transmembrane emp24 domain-containing protein p24delta9-like [Hibiscus syriacus]
MILWHAHQNDIGAVRKLLEEDGSLVHARDYDNRTPLHVASLHGWIDIAKCLLESGADVNTQDRWKNTPLADAEGAKKHTMIELLKSYGGLSYGQSGSHFEPKPVLPPLPNKCDWEIDPSELDFSSSNIIGKGSFGEILKASWRGTPVAVKRILPSLSDDKLVIQDFRHEVKVLVKLRHPNVVQFLGAVTDKKPLMLITEYLRGGDLHRHLKEKGALSASTATNFALDIARNVLLVNPSAEHLKVGDFGLSKLIKVQNCHDVYKMTGETGSYRYMAPEVFKHRKYDKKVDVFSFAMILYEMLEGDPPFSNYDPYEAAKYAAAGHRPPFRSKSYIPELRE